MKGAPEFAVRLTNWQVQPKMAATVFAFEPAAGAKQAQSFPSSCGAPGRLRPGTARVHAGRRLRGLIRQL